MKAIDTGKQILEQLNRLGYEAYFVGGVVRDFLLEENTYDVDLTTTMPISEIKNYFDVFDNGSDYLSVTILKDNFSFEITHFRKDISYIDHRHPVVLDTDSIEEDSLRRDFTINALYMDKDFKIYDFHHGLIDLKTKTIRAIGNPLLRFEEDALRILRGLYLASKLNFEIDKDTLLAMNQAKAYLGSLSKERVYQYFVKIMYQKHKKGIEYIKKEDLFQYIPEFKEWLEIVDSTVKEEDLVLLYYGVYKRFPILPSKEEKRLASILLELLDYDSYTLYKNKKEYYRLKSILERLGCDIIAIDRTILDFKIQEDTDLAVSKADIASRFLGSKKSYAIEQVLRGILSGQLENTKEDIDNMLARL